MHDLHRSLVDYDIAMLRALARSRGVPLDTNMQTEAVDRLADALRDPLSLRTAVAHLSPAAHSALGALLAVGGRMRAPRFARQFGEIRRIGPGRLTREEAWQAPANAAEELWYAGLIFRAFAEEGSVPAEFIYVPTDVQPLLPGPTADAPSLLVETVPAPGRPGTPHPTLVQDLFHYLSLIQNRDVRPDASGNLAQRDQALLHRRTPWAGERRFALVRHLAARLGLVIGDAKDAPLRLEAGAAKRWLTASPGEQLAALQLAWRDDPTWNDLCQVPGLECDKETTWHQRYDPVAMRHALLTFLSHCPDDAWWSLASFVRAIKETDPDFQRPDGDYTGWYVRDANSGEYLSGFESWDRVEAALITDLCTGALSWLGVIQATAGSARPPEKQEIDRACRLMPAGLDLIRRTLAPEQDMPGERPPEAEAPSPVVVRPDFAVEVPLFAGLYTRFQLERLADPDSSVPHPSAAAREETAYHYHLSPTSIGRALARGIRVEQVIAFLRQVSEGRVPANVVGQIQVWAERHGQVALQEVALLRVKSERAMRELLALPQTRALIDRQLSPTTALVRREQLPQLKSALRELGYLSPEE